MERRSLSITTPARKDLRSIRRYSTRMWGRNQAETYVSQLLTAAETLCEFPDRGWSVGDEPSNVRRVTAERHIIYYRVLASEIEIIRILHQRMETPALLG